MTDKQAIAVEAPEALEMNVNLDMLTWGDLADLESTASAAEQIDLLQPAVDVDLRQLPVTKIRQAIAAIIAAIQGEMNEKNAS